MCSRSTVKRESRPPCPSLLLFLLRRVAITRGRLLTCLGLNIDNQELDEVQERAQDKDREEHGDPSDQEQKSDRLTVSDPLGRHCPDDGPSQEDRWEREGYVGVDEVEHAVWQWNGWE